MLYYYDEGTFTEGRFPMHYSEGRLESGRRLLSLS